MSAGAAGAGVEIPRRKPDPTPPVRPVWEYVADPALRARYAQYRASFQVPWVGVFAMAYAAYPTFFRTLFDALRQTVESAVYAESSARLRAATEARAAALGAHSRVAELLGLGFSPREIDEIRDVIEILSHGNFAQLPFAAAPRVLLEGGSLGEIGDPGPRAPRHAPRLETPLVMIEPHHALGDLQAVYGDLRRALGLPFVNTDYRALARWPAYFAGAWTDLKPVLGGAAYAEAAFATHRDMIAAAAALPNPNGLDAAALWAAAVADGSPEETLEVARLFAWLLPGLMLNVAFFRAQLTE